MMGMALAGVGLVAILFVCVALANALDSGQGQRQFRRARK